MPRSTARPAHAAGWLAPVLMALACARGPRRASPPPTVAAASAVGYQNETSIAADPRDPGRAIVAWQVPASTARTNDGGASWRRGPLPGVQDYQYSGDPVAAFDDDGRAFVAYIAFDAPADYDTLGRAARRNGIFVNRSEDGGQSWRPAPGIIVAQPDRPGVPFEDKPSLAVDRSRDPARRGRLYAAWTEFRRHESVIPFSRSVDGGGAWAPPLRVSDRPGGPKDTVGAAEGTTIAVGPDGTVYVAWSDSAGILLDRSADGGRTFGGDRLVARTPDIVFGVRGVERANGYPGLAVDGRGRLYVVWVDRRGGAAAPLIAWSDDRGEHWTVPRPVATDGTPGERFFASLAVDARTGTVAVGYYHATPTGVRYELALSRDRGDRFGVSTFLRPPFDPAGQFLGDYTGIDAAAGSVWAAWTEAVPDSAPGAPAGARRRHRSRVVVGRLRP